MFLPPRRMYLILYSDIIHSVSELEDPCKVEVDGEISLIPSPEQLSSSLNSRHTVEADTVSEIPIVGRVLTVGYESRGKEDGRGNGHPLRVSRVNARRESARKRRTGDLKQIRVTRVMKGWRKTLEEGEASSLMGNIRGVGVSWWKTFRWMIPRVPWRDFRGNGRYGIEQKEAKELVPPIILFHARRPFCFVVIPWVNYSCFLPSSSRNWTRVAFLALSFLVILVIRVIIFRICVYCSKIQVFTLLHFFTRRLFICQATIQRILSFFHS